MKDTLVELFDDTKVTSSFQFHIENGRIGRSLALGSASRPVEFPLPTDLETLAARDPAKAWMVARSRSQGEPRCNDEGSKRLSVVDLFSGCGGFSFGLREAAEQLGYALDHRLAADMDGTALEVYRRNIHPKYVFQGNIDTAVDYRLSFRGERASFGYPPEIDEPLLASLGEVDIVMGGPPCRGHSNLNNRTRRSDDRNTLYLTVPAIAVALNARIVLIENVAAVLNSKPNVVAQARQVLERCGYSTDEAVVEATSFGVAQTRKRHFMLAIRGRGGDELRFKERLAALTTATGLSVSEAIGDLERPSRATSFDTPASISKDNVKRIDYMYDHGLYELPNTERPDCHKDGHTYPSVYGRLRPNLPAGTITGGFLSPGRGRFTHYSQRRGLTPHEGARIQGFPDYFRFERTDGTTLENKNHARLIGDAVPPPMAASVALAALMAAEEKPSA